MLKNKYCVYAHVDEDGYCFYVGSGKILRAYDLTGRNKEWHKHLQNIKYDVYLIYRGDDLQYSYELEAFTIKAMKDMKMCHCNDRLGNIPVVKASTKTLISNNNAKYWQGKERTQETKDKLSIAHTGKVLSEETKQKMSKSQTGKNNGFYGKTHSKETIEKIRETQRRKKNEV